MQGSRSSISTLSENLIFDNGSTSSSDVGIDSEMSWNNMPIPAQNPLPECRIPSSGTHSQYPQHARRDMRNAEWCLGETSSSARQYQPYDILSSDNVEINPNGNQTTNGSFLLQSPSSNMIPRDLNMSLDFEDEEDGDDDDDDGDDDDCQVIERPGLRVSIGSSNDQIRSNGGYAIDESEDRPGCSLDGRRVSCKRKSLDMHAGPSSGVGSSSFFQNAERRQWHTIPENNVSMMPIRAENNITVNHGPEPVNNGLRLGVGRGVSSNPFSFTAPGNSESSRRNFRLCVNNGLHHQNPILAENPFSSDVGNVDVSSSSGHSSRLVLRNRLFDLSPENGSLHGQSSLLDVPSVVRRSHQSRWCGASGTRSSRSFGTSAIPEEGNASLLYEEPTQRTAIPGRVPEHLMGSNSSQNPTNWNLSSNIAGNFASTASRAGSSRARGEGSSAPSGSHRSLPQYPRRLSEIVRRSLLADRGINHVGRSGSFVSSQETGPQSGPDNNNLGRHVPISRSALLERHLDGAFGIPSSWRTLAAAGEGRSNVMSEQIRHVLDLMRRGEGLRFEDVMVLDHSVLFGMADIHDRHRDMRLDVDNMSYEELLALEERIGSVCTGLTEETILSRLKQRKFVDSRVQDQVETEPCSICREEYKEEEDLGTLGCGHNFHKDCIKQWLMHKNLCPICKTTGLTT